MANTPVINSFNAGELSPYLYARNDLKKYNSGCLTLENFQTLPYGGAIRRPAIKLIAESKENGKIRLIEFEFSSSQTYVLEFGDEYIRFFKDGAPVMDGGSPYEIVSPYDIDDLAGLRFIQSADVMWIVHGSYHVQRLSRFGNIDWTIADDILTFPVFLEQNITATTLSISNVVIGAGRNFVASVDLFDVNHVGSYWQLKHPRTSIAINTPNATGAGPVSPTGTANSILSQAGVRIGLYTKGTWAANSRLAVWRSDDNGVTWEQYRYYDMDGRNVDTSWTEDEDEILYCITTTTSPSGTFTLTVDEAYDIGIVQITAVADAQNATATVIRTCGKTTATKRWSEGAWSDYRGYPSAVSLWESRLIFASTIYKPNTLWLSIIDDFNNFKTGTLDDSAMTVTLGSGLLDEIKWLVPQSALIIGTAGSEWAMEAESDNKPVTPSSFALKRKTTYGSSSKIQGVLVNSAVLFVMRQGRKVREFVYNFDAQDYVAPDLTILAEHITEGGIVDAAYQQQPDNTLLAIRADGTMIPMTYERDQDVTGWQRWNNNEFEFESVAVLPRDENEDEIYVSCKLTVDSVVKRYIGILDNREWGTDIATEWNGSDFYTVFDSPGSATLTGLDYLEGKTVSVVRDGMVEPDAVVSGGSITIQKTGTRIVIGLPYTSTMAPMFVEPQSQFVQPMGKHKGVFKAVLRFKDTLSAKVGQTLSTLSTVKFRKTTDPMDAQIDLFSGEKKINFDNTYQLLHTCYVVQDKPLPITVVAMIPWVEVHS